MRGGYDCFEAFVLLRDGSLLKFAVCSDGKNKEGEERMEKQDV